MDKLIPTKKRGLRLISGPIFFLFLTLFFSTEMYSIEVRFIESPKPTHIEKDFKKLVKVKEITEEIDDEHFFAQPSSIAVDDKGNLFVFDRTLIKIFKFDKNFKLVKTFGNAGKGPGDIDGLTASVESLYCSKDGNLYFHCPGNRKIIRFNSEGKVLKEIRKSTKFSPSPSLPVVDKGGNIYMMSLLDPEAVVTKYSPGFEKIESFLTHEDLREFIILKPFPQILPSRVLPSVSNTFYDVFGENGMIVYLSNSSTVYIYQGSKLIKHFRVWPKMPIKLYKESIRHQKAELKKAKYPDVWFIPFISSFFIDSDDDKHFYINCGGKRKMGTLYKFNMEGKLLYVLTHEERGHFKIKKNNTFYGFHPNGKVFAYKEENNE